MAPLNEDAIAPAEADGVAVDEAAADGAADEPQLTPEQKKELVSQLTSDGRRDYMTNELSDASEKFSKAAELAVEVYGDMAVETFDPHFFYGRSLLELARQEDEVIQTTASEMKSVIRGAVTQLAGAVLASQEAAADDAPADDSMTGETEEAPSDEKGDEKKEEATKEEESAPSAEEDGDKDEEDEDVEAEDEEEAEPSNLQLAWEAFDVALLIAEKQENTAEWRQKRADVLSHIAQCNMLNERYEDALEEFTRARQLIVKDVLVGDRLVLEILFHIGRLYSLQASYETAATAFDAAAEYCAKGIERLKSSPETVAEAEELESVLADIRSKAEDARESEKQKGALSELKTELATAASTVTTKTILKPSSENADEEKGVNNITGLVRKKRAADASDAATEGTEPKRAKSEETENVAV